MSTPHCVAIPLLPKVKEEPEHMEEMGVISYVSEPSEWCASMMAVQKSGGKVSMWALPD